MPAPQHTSSHYASTATSGIITRDLIQSLVVRSLLRALHLVLHSFRMASPLAFATPHAQFIPCTGCLPSTNQHPFVEHAQQYFVQSGLCSIEDDSRIPGINATSLRGSSFDWQELLSRSLSDCEEGETSELTQSHYTANSQS